MLATQNLIGGRWVTPSAGSRVARNPSQKDEEIGVVHLSDAGDVAAAGQAAREALPKWAGTNPSARGEILYQAAQLMQKQIDDIARIASREMGKPISEMKGEVLRAVNLLKYYAAEGVRAIGQVIPASQNRVLQYTRRVPLGVVGVITPWNFPVAIPIWKIAPALICGNTVVWKPADIASLTAAAVARVLTEAGLPPGVLNLVIGEGRVIGDALLEKVELDGVSFTGSTSTGLAIAAKCAARNIKYQTEMGGKNAAVVLNDADLSVAVPAIISGAYRSAGQKCTATSRIIVEKGILDAFVAAMRAEMEKLYIGHALDEKSYSGPVASAQQQEKVAAYVGLAEKEAEVVAKSPLQTDPASGYYVPPTLVTGVDVQHALVREEIFGPVATILPVGDFDEAMEVCNKTVFGLSASVFTRDIAKGLRFLEEAEAGLVRVNLETAGVEYQAPFGGMKMSSSHSREQGQAALDFYSQVKTCAVYYGY